MIRIILFLLLIALGAAGAAWIAEQPGDVVLSWGSVKLTATLPIFVLGLGIVLVRELATSVNYERVGARNVLTVTREL